MGADRPFNVLFVCKANAARSAAAEQLLKMRADGLPIAVSSAGVSQRAVESTFCQMIPEMRGVLSNEYGLRFLTHTGRYLTEEIIAPQDLVLCFENAHIARIRERFPQFAGEVSTLPAWVGFPNREVTDPVSLIPHDDPSLAAEVIPHFLRRRMGIVNNEDYRDIAAIYSRTAKEIDGYVQKMVPKLSAQLQPRLTPSAH